MKRCNLCVCVCNMSTEEKIHPIASFLSVTLENQLKTLTVTLKKKEERKFFIFIKKALICIQII